MNSKELVGQAESTAASGDQTAKPPPEVEQGLFSYFLMQRLEGEADIDQNGAVTAGELHQHVRKNVNRFSSGTQTLEFQGGRAVNECWSLFNNQRLLSQDLIIPHSLDFFLEFFE